MGKRLIVSPLLPSLPPLPLQPTPSVVLVADIGGTNARFVLTDTASGTDLVTATLATAEHATFDAALSALSTRPGFTPPSAAAFAVAGPVASNAAIMTNLDWRIDGRVLGAVVGDVPVQVLNDFEAAGYGVLTLPPPSSPSAAGVTITLNAGTPDPTGPIAVLGPGTGLGEAQLFWCPATRGHRVWPSEGSHGGFAPRGEVQRALAASVEADLGFCEVEAVACGAGLARIDAFLTTRAGLPPRSLAPAAVTAAALGGGDPVASQALDTLLAILGAEASAMALRSLTRGGVYLAGGITPKIAPAFEGKPVGSNPLLDAFLWRESGKFAPLLAQIPFIAVLDDGLGLRGAGLVARRLLQGGGQRDVCAFLF